jgi:hypothetical protein
MMAPGHPVGQKGKESDSDDCDLCRLTLTCVFVLCLFIFLTALGFELRAFLGRCTSTWVLPPALPFFALVIFEIESQIYAQTILDSDSPIYASHFVAGRRARKRNRLAVFW